MIIARQLPYARTEAQYNHPCAVWTRASRGNFDAVIALCQALAAEYRYRFDKVHASEAALAWVIHHRSAAQVPDEPEMFNRKPRLPVGDMDHDEADGLAPTAAEVRRRRPRSCWATTT